MSGDWIKMRRCLLTNSKVVRIMSALNADRFRILGALFAAWCLFDEQTEDGKLEGYTETTFDEFVGVPGLCSAMRSVGWIEKTQESIVAVNFTEHNGQSAKRRCQENDRKAAARNAVKKQNESGQKAVPEKRREEKIIESKREAENGLKLEDFPGVTLLQSDQFQEAWARWEQKHRHLRNRSMDFTQRAALLQKLQIGTTGIDDAIALIDYMLAHCDNLHFDGRHRTCAMGLGPLGATISESRPARKTKGQLAMEAMGLTI